MGESIEQSEINSSLISNGEIEQLLAFYGMSLEEFRKRCGQISSYFSYAREHDFRDIDGGLLFKGNDGIHNNIEGYSVALIEWRNYLDGKVGLIDFLKLVHQKIMRTKSYAGNLRNSYVGIDGSPQHPGNRYCCHEEERLMNFSFVFPNHTDIRSCLDFADMKIKEAVKKIPRDDIEIAGLIHSFIISIHPFQDGNGRLARVLTSSYLDNLGFTSARLLSTVVELSNTNEGGSLYNSGFSDKVNHYRHLANQIRLNEDGTISGLYTDNTEYILVGQENEVKTFKQLMLFLRAYSLELLDLCLMIKLLENTDTIPQNEKNKLIINFLKTIRLLIGKEKGKVDSLGEEYRNVGIKPIDKKHHAALAKLCGDFNQKSQRIKIKLSTPRIRDNINKRVETLLEN